MRKYAIQHFVGKNRLKYEIECYYFFYRKRCAITI